MVSAKNDNWKVSNEYQSRTVVEYVKEIQYELLSSWRRKKKRDQTCRNKKRRNTFELVLIFSDKWTVHKFR